MPLNYQVIWPVRYGTLLLFEFFFWQTVSFLVVQSFLCAFGHGGI